jgi:glycosidase
MKTLLNPLRTALLILAAAAFTSLLPAQKPVIQSIDPPDWFAQLPNPMLLVHGSGLGKARFSLHAKGVHLERATASANGDWAFLWLSTQGAHPQTIQITANSASGTDTHPFLLRPRNESAEAHRGFSPSDVIYLVMTDRFADGDPSNNRPASNPSGFDRSKSRGWHGGDFAGLEQHLDYLQSLGVTSLWTTPVYDNGPMPDSYHGYAATNLYDVDHHFGTLDDYRRLSAALHAHGMKLIIDLVPNHIGVQHPWISDPPAPDWFHGTLASHSHSEGDFNDLINPHASAASTRKLTEGWFVDAMPDMNQENPLVAQYLIQNALWWVENSQIDAIRIDTFPYVGRAFWHDYHAALHQAFPNLTTVGEVFNGDPVVTSFFAGGREHGGIDTGLDTPFDFPVYFALRNVLAHDKPMTDLASILRQDSLYPHPERLVHFFGNHDTTRFLTEAGGSLPRLKEALGLMATLRGTPELYSGDEIAMSGGADPENRHDFPGGFPADGNPAQPSAFDSATRTPDQQSTFAWTAALLAVRKRHPVLQGAPQQNLFADETAFVFIRTLSPSGCTGAHTEEAVLVLVNKKPQPRTVTLPAADTALAGCTQFQPLAPAGDGSATLANGSVQFNLPADSFTLFTVR